MGRKSKLAYHKATSCENKVAWLTKEDAEKFVSENEWCSYPYQKYGEVVFAIKIPKGFNFQVAELSKHLAGGLYKGYLEHLAFVTALGERMAVCMNYCKGKTNKELLETEGGGYGKV